MATKLEMRRSSLFPVYFIFFLDNFGFALVFAIFGPLLLDPSYGMVSAEASQGVRNFLIGLLYAVFPLAQLFGAPFIGDLADHFGRKKAFFVTLIGAVIGYVLSAIGILVHSYVLLVIGRLICGFVAGNLAICLASIADMCPTERLRGRHYGLIAMTAGISWIMAMVIGGYFSDHALYHLFNPALPFLVSALLAMIALWAVAALFKETRATRTKKFDVEIWRGFKNIATSFKIREVRWYYVIYFFWVVGWGMTIQWFSPFSIERFRVSELEVSWVLVGFGLAWSLGGSLFNWFLLKKLASSTVAKIGIAATFVLILLTSIAYYYTAFSWIYVISAVFAGIGMSNILNLISFSAPINMQGKVMGLSQSMMALGWIVGPLLGGLLSAEINIDWIYYVAALFLLIALVILLAHQNYKKAQKRNRRFDYID
ncbi:MAG: MFS transporter [Simkaniaceae bacterium]|nr:MFS transporter [Simkaniaceae bacterium]MCF7852550.1 MFS transporter [Simkaniaceae bacterium]